MIETIQPKDEKEWLELRASNINSSEVAALFGLSPYLTAFELWHRKKEGKVVESTPEEWTNWGTRLQDAIAAGFAQDNNLKIRKMTEYMRDTELRVGSSFDFSIEETADGQQYASPDIGIDGRGILEIKNVFGLVFKDQWLEDEEGNFEAPPHIELQVQHQLMISGRAFAVIAALVSGNKIVQIKRLPDPKIIAAIKVKVAEFWASIESNTPPAPNLEVDAEFIASIYGYAEPGKVFNAAGNEEITQLALEYKTATEQMNAGKEKRDQIKAQILMMIGDAEKVTGEAGGEKFSISAGLIGPCPIEAYVREGYRNFKFNWPRRKKE